MAKPARIVPNAYTVYFHPPAAARDKHTRPSNHRKRCWQAERFIATDPIREQRSLHTFRSTGDLLHCDEPKPSHVERKRFFRETVCSSIAFCFSFLGLIRKADCCYLPVYDNDHHAKVFPFLRFPESLGTFLLRKALLRWVKLQTAMLRFGFLQEHNIGIGVSTEDAEHLAVRRPLHIGDLVRVKVRDLLSR